MTREEKVKAINKYCDTMEDCDCGCLLFAVESIRNGAENCLYADVNHPCDIDRNYDILVDAGLIAPDDKSEIENNEFKRIWDRTDPIEKAYDELYSSPLYASTQSFTESEQAFKEASHKISTAMRNIVEGKEQMTETKYYITVNNKTVAENVTIEYVKIFISAIFEVYFNEHDMVVAIAEMPRCKENESDYKRQIS